MTAASALTEHIADLLQAHGLRPNHVEIAQVVHHHKERFIKELLAQAGLHAGAESELVRYLRSIDDLGVIDRVVRKHAALLSDLEREVCP